jgi:hypothetical protein
MLRKTSDPSAVRWQVSWVLLLLLSMAPALCRAAYDPPPIYITSRDVQAVIQCYLDAAGSGGQGALSACDRQAGAMSKLKRRPEQAEEDAPLPGAPAATNVRMSGSGWIASSLFLSGAAALLGLLWSLTFLRRSQARHKPDQPYCAAGDGSWV